MLTCTWPPPPTRAHTQTRDREIAVWDTRALTSPLARESVDTAPGVLLPFFDADTNMLFFVGKVRVRISPLSLPSTPPSAPP